jgi:hypothetical protein
MRHAEVAPHPLFGRAALAVADDQHLFAGQPGHAAGHRLVVAKGAIAVNFAEIGEYLLDEVHRVGPLGMPRPLNPDPRRRHRLRLNGNPCFLFAHLFLVVQSGAAQDRRDDHQC